MDKKRCTVCGTTKPLDQFRQWRVRGRFGYRPLCRDCQREYEARWRAENRGRLKDARAARAGQAQEYARRYRSENRAAYLIAECRRRSVRMGYAFDLDAHVDVIQARMNAGRCEVTGYPLDLSPVTSKYERRPNSPSLDRIDPARGYLIGNVRVVCLAVNLAMSNWGESAVMPILKAWCEEV